LMALVSLCGASAGRVLANDLLDKAFAESKMSGAFRWYNYDRYHNNNGPQTTHAMAVGGDFLLKTGALAGFSAGLGIYTAHNVDIYSHLNEVLIGPDSHLNAIPQAYFQYRQKHFLARAGRQLIDTPWARPDMFTMLPRSFYGVVATIAPLRGTESRDDYQLGGALPLDGPTTDLMIFAGRMSEFYESRFKDQFSGGNRYSDAPNNGFLVTGFRLRVARGLHRVDADAWFYNFYDFATLGHFEAHYQTVTALHPVLAFQSVIEGSSGTRRLGAVHSRIYGVLAGLGFPRGTVSLVGNYSPVAYATFRHGGLIHPYSDLSGTLFTDTMNNGIGDIGPGYAYGLRGEYELPRTSLLASAAYVGYLARYGFGGAAYQIDGPYYFPQGTPVPNQRQWAVDLGVVYTFHGLLDGLRIEDHVGSRDFADSTYGVFTDHRFALIYAF
jgi:hypothetical protein